MSGLTRDRGCLYYIPWIALAGSGLLVGGVVVWVTFANNVYNSTNRGLDVLGIGALNLSRPRPAYIATAVVYLFWVVVVLALLLARSFIEAAHDATGLSGAGSSVWMVLNAIFATGWWLIVAWLVVALMGCTAWAGLLYTIRGAIDYLNNLYGLQPAVTWLASDNLPCPGQCLNLGMFKFLDTSLQNSCVCDYAKLTAARAEFDEGFRMSVPMLIGNLALLVAGIIIMVNFACAFSHTKREKEYIRRLTYKQFIGF